MDLIFDAEIVGSIAFAVSGAIVAMERRLDFFGIIILAVIDIIFTMVVFFLFRYGFKIVLPAGIFTITL